MKLNNALLTTTILAIFLSINYSFSQAPTATGAPMVAEVAEVDIEEDNTKKFIIQPYLGAVNMKKWAYDANQSPDFSSKGNLHYGVTGEVRINQRIGIGLDLIYTPFQRTENLYYNFTYPYDYYAPQSYAEVTENKLRVIPRLFIHFNIDEPQWDLYISGGIGANIIFTKLRVDGEEQESYNYYNNYFPIVSPAFPIAGRFCFGVRYDINEFLGVNFETGIGGPPFSLGMHFRF